MSSLHETEVDGVRCFWTDAQRPTLTARLMFRQGMADEVLSESGWLHLLEHLCLHGRGGGVLDVNGSVSILETQFDAHGPSGVVAEHLGGVCAWLARPDFGELNRERGVLRAEARLRGSAVTRALNWRYGAQGPGLVAYDEPGLALATAEALAERVARVFTAGNAVLALNGPPPAGLHLPLRPGRFLPPRPAAPCENDVGMYVDEAGLVLSGVVERSHAATWVPEIIQRALKQRLRDELGAAYSPSATYERVDSSHAVVVAGSDVLPEALPHLADRVLDLVGQMASEPVPAQWIDQMRAARLQSLADPDIAGAQAWRAAYAVLVGDPAEDLSDLVEKTHTVDGDQIRHELTTFCDSLLLGLPGESAWRDQLPPLRFPSSQLTPGGAAFRSAEWPANRSILHLAADRISISDGERVIEAPIAELAGMYSFPDGGRHLVRQDGWSLRIEPQGWQRSAVIAGAVDAAVPSHLHLPQSAREVPVNKRTPWLVRWWTYLSSRSKLWPLGIVLLIMVTIYGLAITVDHLPQDVLQKLGSGVQAAIVIAGVIAFLIARKGKTSPTITAEPETCRTLAPADSTNPNPNEGQGNTAEPEVTPTH